MMEHRCSSRHEENYRVIVSDRKGQQSRGKVLNASNEGICAKLDNAVFDQGEVVDVQFPSEENTYYGSDCVAAYVVYVDEDQLGLWLLDE